MSAPVQGTRLFVGNLKWTTDDDSLMQAFNEVAPGEVVEAKVITDRLTGRSRGFGFVTLKTPDVASAALEKMNGKSVDGREIRVDMATSQRR